MAKKQPAAKKRAGRPEGRIYTELVQVWVTAEMLGQLERHQRAGRFRKFTDAMRDLLERGLKNRDA